MEQGISTNEQMDTIHNDTLGSTLGKESPMLLQPKDFSEYIGQERAKMILSDAILSAKKRRTSVSHILISSIGPGVGKTTLATLMAEKIKSKVVTRVASSIESYEDIYSLFSEVRLALNPVIVIDEIHRIKHALAETIYLAMENPKAEFTKKRTMGALAYPTIVAGNFTLVGLTAGQQGMMPKPFLDRFDIKITLQKYTEEEIAEIVKRSAKRLNVQITADLAKLIAQRAIFTPRIANSLLKRVRDYTLARNVKTITKGTLDNVFTLLGIDNLGLDETARMVLSALATSPTGSCGLNSLASISNIDMDTLKNLVEPQLLLQGLIVYMARGRAVTEKGLRHIGREDRIPT